MGFLDDAIREHLELKRQHGADPSEVERMEHEALGPVRRQPFEQAGQKSGAPTEVDDHSAGSGRASGVSDPEYEEYDEQEGYSGEEEKDDWGEAFDEGSERPGSRAPNGEASSGASRSTTTEEHPPPEHKPERGISRWRRVWRSGVPPEEAPPTQADPPAHALRRDETVEYDVEDAAAARGGKAKEVGTGDQPTIEDEADVLEETPEFLQDAPEHDRLRFEQRPPRDFDFDD